jgi:hypothetical protein
VVGNSIGPEEAVDMLGQGRVHRRDIQMLQEVEGSIRRVEAVEEQWRQKRANSLVSLQGCYTLVSYSGAHSDFYSVSLAL